MLSDKEKYRYSRQISLTEFGEENQLKLKNSSVIVVGAGGLGNPVLQIVSGAGIGTIGIIDFDTINVTNLHRQFLFDEKQIGENKAIASHQKLKTLNSGINFKIYPEKLTNKNALDILSNYDIIVDACDNYTLRYIINDAAIILNKPVVFGGVYKWEGSVAVFNFKNGPTYRCIFPNPPTENLTCEMVGIIPSVCAIVGARQANEVIKMITGVGQVLSNGIEIIDCLNNTTSFYQVERNTSKVNEHRKTIEEFKNYDYALFCQVDNPIISISSQDFLQLANNNNLQILDIRQTWEGEPLPFQNVISIPMQDIESGLNKLDSTKKCIVVCTYGTRSSVIVEYLKMKHQFKDVLSLKGGIQALFESV